MYNNISFIAYKEINKDCITSIFNHPTWCSKSTNALW